MSSTPPPGEPDETATAPVTPVEGSAPPASPPPAAGPLPPSSPPPPPPYAGWAPVPRPPRVPWVNPDRRLHLAGAAIIAGLVLLAGGFGIGWAASSGGDHHREFRGGYGDMRGPGGMMRGDYPGMQLPRGQFPQRPFPNASQSAGSAAPSATSTK